MAVKNPDIEALLEYADSIIATLREPFLVLDKRLCIISANHAFYATFKTTEKETIGRLLTDLGGGQWNIPALLKLLKEIIPEKKAIKDYEVGHRFEQIGERVMVLNACQLRIPDKVTSIIAAKAAGELILLAIEDITERKRLQTELKESEERYHRAFETSRDGLLLVHKTEGDILNSNEAAQELLGYSHEEFLSKKLWEIGVTKDLKDFQETLSRLERDGVVNYDNASVKTRSGLTINSEVFLVNRAKVAQCNIRNITERKRLEHELTQAKEVQFRTLIENLPGKIFLKDRSSVYISCNESYAKDLRVKPDEIAGKTDYDFFPTYLAEKYRADDRRVMDSGKTESIEEEYMVMKDFLRKAQKTTINTVKVPVHSKDGSIVGLFGLFWDITERKNLETDREETIKWQKDVDSLKQSLLAPDMLENKLKIITDGIVRIFDVDFCRIWLIKPGDMCEKGCIHAEAKEGPHVCRYRDKCLHLMTSSGRYTHTDGRGHSRVPFGCYKIGLVASEVEHKFLTNDVTNDPRVHNHEWARELGLKSFAGYQLKIPNGETIGVLALFSKHPITPVEDAMLDSFSTTIAFIVQQAAAEDEKVRLLGLKTLSEIKSKFTSMVSHELRSPMAVIKESINLILEELVGSITPEQKDILSTAKSNIDRLGRLINNVLDFQKIEAGKIEFDIKEHDLNEVVLTTSKEMNLLATEKGISFTVNIDEDLPKIKFDKDRIVQVLTNLLSNAIKFTEKGGIIVSTERSDNMAHVIVQDTGPGIQSRDISKLFQTFERLAGPASKKKSGTGLGLAISKDIIQAHNGKIWVDSKPGKGSAFHFILPIKERRGQVWQIRS